MLNAVVIGIAWGLFGYLVSNILVQPGEVLSWWPGLVQRLNRSHGKGYPDWSLIQYWNNKTTWLCGKCIAGFWALASCFLNYSVWNVWQGFVIVTLSIFTAYATEKWMN